MLALNLFLNKACRNPNFMVTWYINLEKLLAGMIFLIKKNRKIIIHYKRTGYNMNAMQQTACLVVNPITVNNFAALFNCMPAGQTSDLMKAPA